MRKIIIQGAGGHAKVVMDCLIATGEEVVAVYDPKFTDDFFGVPRSKAYAPDQFPDALAVIAVGDNAVRKNEAARYRHDFTNAIHPSAIISPFAKYGKGNVIFHRAIIQPHTVVADHVIINTAAQVDHDCHIGSFAHLAPGVVLCGSVSIGEGALVGAGSVIIPGRKIGAWAVIGAGAVVIDDIPDYAVAVGNPAHVIKYNKP